MMFRKYGYGRLTAQIGVDIRKGLISRDEALAVVRARDGLYPERYLDVGLDDVLRPLQVTRSQFEQMCAEFACSSAA